MGDDATAGRRVLVLADDLIWSTRLAALLSRAGAVPVGCAGLASFRRGLVSAGAAVVDLTARAYDPLTAVHLAADAGLAVVCVGQHDDLEVRRAALEAGAGRVYPYRKLAEDGPRTLRRWLDGLDDVGVGGSQAGAARATGDSPREYEDEG